MIVCDRCKAVDRKAYQCRYVLAKQDEPPPKKRPRGKDRDVASISVHLCEPCITEACRGLASVVHEAMGATQPVRGAKS